MKRYIGFFFAFLILLPSALSAEPTTRDVRVAIQRGDNQAINTMIKDKVDFIALQNKGNKSDLSALELAIYFRKHDILTKLVSYQPAIVEHFGTNALKLACSTNKQDKAAIELLVTSGVNINTPNSAGQNCLYSAAVAVDVDFFEYLITLGANPKTEITPHKWLNMEGPITVEAFLQIRLKRHQAMLDSIQ